MQQHHSSLRFSTPRHPLQTAHRTRRRAMIKNFSAGDIWVGVTPDSTKTDGMIRIPSEGAQLLVSFCAGQYGDLIDTVYVMADAAEENCVEVQALEW